MITRDGQYGLTRIGGRLGWWVSLGQFLLGDASRYTHAFIVCGYWVVEAMPGGAILSPLSKYEGRADVVWSRLHLEDAERLRVTAEALDLIGTPYSYLDYLALALDHIGIRPKRLAKFIRSERTMICSQLVDSAYKRAGIHLFQDGRLPQDVTPGDLADLLTRGEGQDEELR